MKQNIKKFINDNIHKLYHEMLKCINQLILSKSKLSMILYISKA